MNREEFFYLLPYLFSLALSLGVFVYTWQHRQMRGARVYAWFVGGQTLMILGFIFELVSPNLQTKLLWDKFQWLTVSFLVFIPFLIFSLQFSEHKLRYPRFTWGYWFGIPILFTMAMLTDSLHHLVYPNPHLSIDYPFPELQYDFTLVVYLYALLYIYGANFYGLGLLIRRAVQPLNLYRLQYWIIIAGFSIPLILSFFSLANIRIAPQRDVAPFSFAIGNLVVAWGLFRHKLFNIVPIAREHIVENMVDPVVVLDARNRVVDMNPAARTALRKQNSEVIGHSATEVFENWPVIVSELEFLDVEQKEIAIEDDEDDTFFYDLNISSINSRRNQLIGRIIVARDITRHKTLEAGYRVLSQELDQRVKERTEELRKIAERYRAVVENQTEFIVHWSIDGTRTFVNEAYLRYWSISLDEALTLQLLSHIMEADQPGVEENTADLLAGAVDNVVDTHRVIKPDGSIAWHEWITRSIRDDHGSVVEFQSIGRDITERKLAEEALRESEAIYRKAIEVAGAVPYRQSYPGEDFHIDYDFIGDGIRQITGYGPEEFHEDLWDSLVQESRPTGELAQYPWREAVQRVRTGASPIWQCEHRILAHNGETHWVYEAAVELRDKDGQSHGSIGMYQDITERKQTEQIILNQLAFDSLIMKFLNKLSSSTGMEIDTSIETGLKEISEFMGAEYADILILSEDKTIWTTTHKWSAPHLETIKHPTQIIPTGTLTWSENMLLKGKSIRINILADYPPEALADRAFSEAEGTKSLLSVPIRGMGELIYGCIDLVAYTRQVNWSDSDVIHLTIIGDVIANTLERKRAEENLAEAYDTTLEGWAKALELRDKETEGHSRRVTETTLIIARTMGFSEDELVHIRRGSILHDIGKMGIPDDILRKNGPLTDEERVIVQRHPTTALNLLKPIAYLEKALDIPYYHHEKWDGTGYPCGLRGEEIPLPARIFAIVDVWDALSSDRPYRKAWTREVVIQYLINDSGKHFDPRVVDVFLTLVEKGEI